MCAEPIPRQLGNLGTVRHLDLGGTGLTGECNSHVYLFRVFKEKHKSASRGQDTRALDLFPKKRLIKPFLHVADVSQRY